MFKTIVNELVGCETIDLKIRSNEGDEFILQVKPEEKFTKLKEEIWKNIGVRTQMKIGDAIIDIMTDYIQTTDLSYDSFCSLPEPEQVRLLAQSGRFYQKFWQYYMVLFDGHIIEDEATVVGLGLASGDELAVLPKAPLGKRENLFLQLFVGTRRKKTDIAIGINNIKGTDHDCAVRDKNKLYHSHSDPGSIDQCAYELRLLETILMPTFDKIMSGEKEELPESLPKFENIKALLRMCYYQHSYDALKDIHDLAQNYLVNINIMINFNEATEEVKFEAEKRETIYYSVMELLKRFEESVTNGEDREYIYPSIYVGPSRSFNQYNYTVALPCVQLNRITSTTTIEDLIESYKHYVGKEDLEIQSLMYDGMELLPYVVVKKVANKKLNKHFFYFHHDLPNDGRNIDELLNFIDGESVEASSSTATGTAPPATPKIKKKRRKNNKVSIVQQHCQREKSDSISEDVSVTENLDVPEASGGTNNTMGATGGVGKEAAGDIKGAAGCSNEAAQDPTDVPTSYKLEKSGTDQMKKIWQEFSDRNQGQRKIFEASREFDFDITEEEGGPHDMTLEKADYLDKLTNMIAAKAQAEWENKMKGFEKLQEENEEIQLKIKSKEKEYDCHKDKVTEMIDNQAKAMTNYISVISKTEDEKAEKIKEIKKLDLEISDLEAKILKVKEAQQELTSKCQLCDTQIDKMEKKRKKLEKYMETEMGKVKQEGEEITQDIEKLNEALKYNIKATEDLAKVDIAVKPETNQVTTPVNESTNRMLDFISKSIKEKEADLECPVCMETADVPIYMCPEMHLICSSCRPKVKECPECRVHYQGPPRRHRYAEKTAEELKKLKEEFAQLTSA